VPSPPRVLHCCALLLCVCCPSHGRMSGADDDGGPPAWAAHPLHVPATHMHMHEGNANRALVTGGGGASLHGAFAAGSGSGVSGVSSPLPIGSPSHSQSGGSGGGGYPSHHPSLNSHMLFHSPASTVSAVSSLSSMSSASVPPSSSPSPSIQSASPPLPHSNVYVAGIPHHWSKAMLDEYFSPFGVISESRVLLDKITAAPRGIAFVRFQHVESARLAIQHCNGTTPSGQHTQLHTTRTTRGMQANESGFLSSSVLPDTLACPFRANLSVLQAVWRSLC